MTGLLSRTVRSVSRLIELVSNQICHCGLCHYLLKFHWAIPIVWEFVFLQRHVFLPERQPNACWSMKTPKKLIYLYFTCELTHVLY